MRVPTARQLTALCIIKTTAVQRLRIASAQQ